MGKLLATPKEPEPSLSPIYKLDELPPEEREQIQRLAGSRAEVRAVVDSDLLASGRYGRTRLVLADDELFVEEDGSATKRLPLSEVASAFCRDFVGNGLLEVRTREGRRVELIRYSKTTSPSFQEIAERINQSLEVTDDELEAQEEEVAKTSGPREAQGTYRCPNCGHPLKYPSDACPKCTCKRQVVLRLARMMSHHWRLAALGAGLAILFTIANLGPGILVQQLVDKSLNAQGVPMEVRRTRLLIVVGVFLALISARMVTHHFRIKTMGTLGERVVADLRRRVYRTLQRLSLSYYDREHTGRIMTRVLSDTRTVQRFVVQGLQQLVVHSLTVIGISAVLFVMHWRLAALALLPIPLVVMCGRVFSRKFHTIFRSVRRKFAALSASVAEVISGMRVVKSFAQEDREIQGFEQRLGDCTEARLGAVRAKAKFAPAVTFMMGVGTIIVWYVGGGQVLGNTLTLGTLILFINYMQRFYNPVQQLLNLTESFQDSATSAERIFNIMDMPSDVADHDKATELDDVEGRIELHDVSFSYDDGEKVLKNINLTVQPGEMIGLVGETGSGKSTLVSLICRFYDPEKGRILLDGVDLEDIRTKSLRGHIGMVLQDSFLFAGTIKENIAYSRPGATEEEIIQAAKAANAHEFVMNLPDGYDSEVGEGGVMLSGGEKQRISIARAVLKDPAILILDEATSAVDTATEAAIQEAMDRLVAGRTTIAIAHRLSTLRNADRLLVMENGEIIEQGTHEQLMDSDGVYANLVKIQSQFTSQVAAAG
ncbi:MAG: ABC transporter transmembrane domain-containing protein [Candidatus Brocadiia bacterium]